MAVDSVLHIPEQIRFQCTRCAHCCNYWPVPLTDGDVNRFLSQGHRPEVMTKLNAESPVDLGAFSHVLEKNNDGFCYFLDNFNCTIENSAKPSMCRLFPYSFMDCPEGVYVGLSFASSGVLANSGSLLSEQGDILLQSLTLFRELFPELRQSTIAGWQKTSLLSGLILPYSQVKLLVDSLAQRLRDGLVRKTSALNILAQFFNDTVSQAPSAFFKRDAFPNPQAAQRAYLSGLKDVYLEEQTASVKALTSVNDRLITEKVRAAILNGEASTASQMPGAERIALPKRMELTEECRLLLLRFAYVRVHSRLFFGPGFSSLSFLTGLGHLISLVALLHLEMHQYEAQGERDDAGRLSHLSEKLRQLDGKLTSARYGENARAMLDLLFLDRNCVDRLREYVL